MFLDTTSTSYIIYFFLVKLVKWSQLLTVAIVSHLLSVFLSANALTANYSLCLAEMEENHIPTIFVRFLQSQNSMGLRKFNNFCSYCTIHILECHSWLYGTKRGLSYSYVYFHTFTWYRLIHYYALKFGTSPASLIVCIDTDRGLFVSSTSLVSSYSAVPSFPRK